MKVRWLAIFACLLGAFALGMTACGDDDDDGGDSGGGGGGGETVNVYSSLPLQGAQRPQTTAGGWIKLALEEKNGKAGETTVKYTSLDDSTAQAGTWTPEATQANAQKVAGDESADRLHRRVQLGRERRLDPDPERGPDRPDQPVEHAVGLTWTSRAPTRASPTSTT